MRHTHRAREDPVGDSAKRVTRIPLSRNKISVRSRRDTDTATPDPRHRGEGRFLFGLIGDPKTDANGNITLETEFGSIALHKDGTYTYDRRDRTQSSQARQRRKSSPSP